MTAVDRLNLTIKSGELFSLLGVNGARKTTTIKMLSCLTKPTSGDAILLGKSIVNESTAAKEIIAVSPQETAVAPNLTVKENLELMAGVHGFSRDKSKARVPWRCKMAWTSRPSPGCWVTPLLWYPAGASCGKAHSLLADHCHSLTSLHPPPAALGSLPAGFTLDTYAHVTTAAQKEAAQTMGNVLAVK